MISDIQAEIAELDPKGAAHNPEPRSKYPSKRLNYSHTTATIAYLMQELAEMGTHDPAWHVRMWHKIPHRGVVDRVQFILERTRQRVVLDCGFATSALDDLLRKQAAKVYGLDKLSSDKPDTYAYDFDWCAHKEMPYFKDVELIVVAEVLEHLSNPGWFLQRLRESYQCPMILTVPNAGANSFGGGIECVNRDHVAWYSWKTIDTLLTRHGWQISEFYWYNGKPIKAEGLIVVAEHS